jgi:hypothetical protein
MRRRRGGRPGGGITESPGSTSITSTRPGGHCWSWGSSYCPRASLGGGQLVIVSIALWRVAEILTWYVKLLFDKGHRVFLEVERNFFFLIADALIFVTALALALETVEEGARARTWGDAFSAFTLNGAPGGYDSGWAAAVGVLGAVGGLALLAAGLGLVIGIIGDRIKEAQDAVAEEGVPRSYTGPTRPAPPWEEGAPRRLFGRAWRRVKEALVRWNASRVASVPARYLWPGRGRRETRPVPIELDNGQL